MKTTKDITLKDLIKFLSAKGLENVLDKIRINVELKNSNHYGCAHCESTIGKMKITKTSRKFICGECDYITVFKK